MKRRINIGFIIDDIDNYFSNHAARGAEQAAKALDANLFIFPGHYIGKTDSRYADRKYTSTIRSSIFLQSVMWTSSISLWVRSARELIWKYRRNS